MKTPRILAALLLALTASASSAQTDTRTQERLPTFEVEVACENGVGRIGVLDAESNTYLNVGSVSRDAGRAESTTQLLRPQTRSWIGEEILFPEGSSLDDPFSSDLGYEIASCIGDPDSPVAATGGCSKPMGMCFCYPDSDTDCDIFHTICTATGGESGHNSCSW